MTALGAGCERRGPRSLPLLAARDTGILYVATEDSRNRLNIFRMEQDGSRPHNLSRSEAFEFDPAWSPDRTRIAFAAVNDLGEGKADLYLMRADGSGRRRLTDLPPGSWAGEPTWSPDGHRLIFTRTSGAWAGGPWRSEDAHLYRIDADGSHLVRLRAGRLPSWSPDGRNVLFTHPVKPDRGQPPARGLWLMDPDGRRPRLLTRRDALAGVWSPDGRKIAYIAIVGAESRRFSYTDLFIMNADGSQPRQVTISSVVESPPHWSADGRQLLFTCLDYRYGTPQSIYRINADGSNRKSLPAAVGFCWIGSVATVPYLVPFYGQPVPRPRKTHPDFHPLVRAIATGSLDPLRQRLDRGADPNAACASGRSVLMEAAQFGSPAMLRLLLDRGANSYAAMPDGRTALWWAVNGHRPENVRLLLEKGACIDTRDGHGRTPLMLACDLHDLPMLRLLLDRGAAVNARDRNRETVLHHAVATGSLPLVKTLLERDVDLDARGAAGQTPLIRAVVAAATTSKVKPPVLRALIERGADPSIKDSSGRTALAWAGELRQPQLLQIMKQATAAAALSRTHSPLLPRKNPGLPRRGL